VGGKTGANNRKYTNEPAVEIFELAEKTRSKKNSSKSELEEELETSCHFSEFTLTKNLRTNSYKHGKI
jgi:hypothetical protein